MKSFKCILASICAISSLCAFSACDLHKIKQISSHEEFEEVVYNTECDFAFVYTGVHNNDDLDVTITNKTTSYISGLTDFSILIYFDDEEEYNRNMSFYAEEIMFEEPLAPNASITIKNIQGISVKNWSTDDWWSSVTFSKSRYTKQQYTVIYS